MQAYKDYLLTQDFTQSTIESYLAQIRVFINWSKANNTTGSTIDYATCLQYIAYLHRKNTSKKTVNHRLGVLKNYLNYLVLAKYRSTNPVASTTIKGAKKYQYHHLLNYEELEVLYQSYPTENLPRKDYLLTAKRNKIILGFMIYQGLSTTNLKALQIEDLDLNQGKVYIRNHKKSNARSLELKAWQIIALLEYCTEIHPLLIRKYPGVDTSKLCIPNNNRLSNTVRSIIKTLQKTHSQVYNIHQIRASVITYWLGIYNLRKVQYLAGHRYISATEKYVQDDLENLHEIVNQLHPIS